MKILVLGSGAREHTIIATLRRDTEPHDIWAAPGNAGIAEIADLVALDPTNPAVVRDFALSADIELVIIGPEAPLVAGVANVLRAAGIAVFGPSKEAAQLEGSKAFAKEIMNAAGVPTGSAHTVSTMEDLENALDSVGAPYVVKADGLASGKGVLVTESRDDALEHGRFYLQHGDVLVEEFLTGPEVSLFFVTDGKTVVPLTPAQDYKRAYDNDEGPNTGGMGAYSPLPWLPDGFVEDVKRDIAEPVVREMAARGIPFQGLLYCGLIVTPRGVKVIEFNARFGDPETQVVLARLTSPLASLLFAAATDSLDSVALPTFTTDVAITVVLASEGYPENPQVGRVIDGVTDALSVEHITLAHAGTAKEGDRLVATGGRVLSVIATAENFGAARTRAYDALSKLTLEGSHYRRDIARRMVS